MNQTKRKNRNNHIALNKEERIFLADSIFQVRSLVRAAKDEEEENMDVYNLMTVAEDKLDKILELFDEKSIT